MLKILGSFSMGMLMHLASTSSTLNTFVSAERRLEVTCRRKVNWCKSAYIICKTHYSDSLERRCSRNIWHHLQRYRNAAREPPGTSGDAPLPTLMRLIEARLLSPELGLVSALPCS